VHQRAHTVVLVAAAPTFANRRADAVAKTIRSHRRCAGLALVHILYWVRPTMQRARRERGTATVEYVILLMVIVLPFSVAMVALSNHLVPFFDCIEYLNGLSLP
jgi:hypothetical protein